MTYVVWSEETMSCFLFWYFWLQSGLLVIGSSFVFFERSLLLSNNDSRRFLWVLVLNRTPSIRCSFLTYVAWSENMSYYLDVSGCKVVCWSFGLLFTCKETSILQSSCIHWHCIRMTPCLLGTHRISRKMCIMKYHNE